MLTFSQPRLGGNCLSTEVVSVVCLSLPARCSRVIVWFTVRDLSVARACAEGVRTAITLRVIGLMSQIGSQCHPRPRVAACARM